MKKDSKPQAKPAVLSIYDLDLIAAGGVVMVFLGTAAKSLFDWFLSG